MFDALICLAGIVVLIAGFALSTDRATINWRMVSLALLLQVLFGALVLYVPVGRVLLEGMTAGVGAVLSYAQDGITFMFGEIGTGKFGLVFAFQVLPAIIFFSSLISVLYYIGVMQWVMRIIGGLFAACCVPAPRNPCGGGEYICWADRSPIAVRPSFRRCPARNSCGDGGWTVRGSHHGRLCRRGRRPQIPIAASFMPRRAVSHAKIFVPETPGAELKSRRGTG